MDERVQNGLRGEQWLATCEKAEKRSGSLGSGALRFIRTRSSIRRELKRQSTRSKNGDSLPREVNGGSGVGGLGKWLREHLGGSSKGNHNAVPNLPSKTNGNANDGTMYDKSFGRTAYVSQNLYCSLPREQGRHFHNGHRKSNHCGVPKSQDHDRPRSSSLNYHEKFSSTDLGIPTRGSPFYGSEGKSLRKRNRDRRRYSLNETHEQGRHRRKRDVDETQRKRTLPTDAPNEPLLKKDIEVDFDYAATMFSADDDIQRNSLYQLEEEGDKDAVGLKDKKSWHEKEVEDAYTEEKLSYDESKFPERCRESDEEEEEEEEEKDVAGRLAASTATEKFEEEVPEVESDHVFAEIPAEILADRETMINKLRELHLEHPALRRKNRLLEIFVAKHLEKNQRKITPPDPNARPEEIDKMYRLALRSYKLELDEIMARRSQMMQEIDGCKQRVQATRKKDERNFKEFLGYERSVAVGLIYAKNGRKITEKFMNEIAYRQTVRRETLIRHRLYYILCQHRFNKIKRQLRDLEVLGPGMTTMDYETLRMVNISHKDKLDERDRELEEMRAKIEGMANTLAHFKEKKVCLIEDIENEGQILTEYRERAREIREDVNALHTTLKALRREWTRKKFEAGLLVAQPVLREMEKTKRQLDALKNNVERVKNEIQQYQRPNNRPMK